MKFLLALLVLVAVVASKEYKADKPISEALIKKYLVQQFNLHYGNVRTMSYPKFGKNAIDDKIIALLEAARDQFHVGFPDSGIPPLDPLHISHFSTHVHEPLIVDIDFTLDDISVVGLQSFVIENFNFKIVGLTVDFEFSLPKLSVTAKYAIDGHVALVIHVYPSGDASAELDGIDIKGTATLGTNDGFLYLKGFETAITFDKFKVALSGILGDGLINELFDWVLSQISDSVLQGQKDNIAQLASDYIITIGNELLKNVSLADLIG